MAISTSSSKADLKPSSASYAVPPGCMPGHFYFAAAALSRRVIAAIEALRADYHPAMLSKLTRGFDAAWRARTWRLGLWILIAAGFTWKILDYSMRRGRLVVPPAYDDVTYMADGLRRLRILQQDGLLALVQDLWRVDTHSAYSSGMAGLSFAVLGAHDWVPYVSNGFIILGMLLGVDALCRGRPVWEKIGLGLFVLFVPLSGYAVQEFRPDIAAAVCGTICVGVILNGPWLKASRLKQAATGLLAGFALVIKPTFAPLMIGWLGLALLLAALRDRQCAPAEWSWQKALKSWLLAGFAAFLAALPYYAVNTGHLIEYYRMVYERYAPAVIELTGPVEFDAGFYLTGYGGSEMLGRHVYLWAGLFLAGLLAAIRMKQRTNWWSCVAWGVLILTTFMIVNWNHLRSQFLGLPFQVLLLAALLANLKWFFSELENRAVPMYVRVAIMLFLLIGGYFCAQRPPFWGRPHHERATVWHAAANELDRVLGQDASAGQRIFLTTTGDINKHLLHYMNLKAGRPRRKFSSLHFQTDVASYVQEINQAHWVVASEPGNTALAPHVPSTYFAGKSLALVEGRADFKRVAAVPSYAGKHYVVFRRVSNAPTPQAP